MDEKTKPTPETELQTTIAPLPCHKDSTELHSTTYNMEAVRLQTRLEVW